MVEPLSTSLCQNTKPESYIQVIARCTIPRRVSRAHKTAIVIDGLQHGSRVYGVSMPALAAVLEPDGGVAKCFSETLLDGHVIERGRVSKRPAAVGFPVAANQLVIVVAAT